MSHEMKLTNIIRNPEEVEPEPRKHALIEQEDGTFALKLIEEKPAKSAVEQR